MSEYKPNSEKSKKDPEKRVKQVAVGKTRKKGLFREIADNFTGRDIGDVKTYIGRDVLVPAIKSIIYDIVTNSVKMFLYPGGGGPKSNTPASKVSYNKFWGQPSGPVRNEPVPSRSMSSYEDVMFHTAPDAESVLDGMFEVLDTYGLVSVADLYDLSGIRDENYTNNNYGWSSLSTAQIQRVPDGYILRLPKPMPFDRVK